MDAIQKLFDFTTYIEGFKKLERFVSSKAFFGKYPFPERYESDADHSWRMAMMLVILEKHLEQPIDLKKAMTMALIHDLPEMIAGDPPPLGSDGTGKDSHAYNEAIAKEKFEREKAAAEKIFGKLPEREAKELLDLWHEFEAQETYESKVVMAIDKLEGKLQSLEYTGGVMFKQHYDFTLKYGVPLFDVDPVIKAIGEIVIEKAKDSYQEFTEDEAVEAEA